MTTATTYREFDALLHRKGTDKPIPSRKISNNTYAQRRGNGDIAVKLHGTDVVTFHPDESITLDTGGWHTVTTKQRMNAFTPPMLAVHTVRGRWLVAHLRRHGTYSDGGRYTAPDYEHAADYQDRMTFTPTPDGCFEVEGSLSQTDRLRQDRHNAQVNKMIDRYLRNLTAEEHAHALAWPNDGRCSMCIAIRVKPAVNVPAPAFQNTFQLIGEAMGDTQHLIEHMLDKVYPGNLLSYVSSKVNPGGIRSRHLNLNKADLRNYLRSQLLVGSLSIRGARRAA